MTLADWHPPLTSRHGGLTRLCGLEIRHDFDWHAMFGHGRSTFPGGQRLTESVQEWCPAGKQPVLVLTTNADEPERVIEDDSEYIVICHIERWLREHDRTDPVAAHFGSPLGPGIVGAARLGALGPDEIQAFLDVQMDGGHVALWAAADPDRLDELRRIAGAAEEPQAQATAAQVAAAVRALGGLDAQIVEAVADMSGRESRLDLLHALTALPEGRADAGAVIVERTPQRLQDARAATAEYETLLAGGAGERDLQRFIEANPWLLGLEYTRVRHRHPVPRGELDFILDRYDGYHDVLELKDPQDPIIVAPDTVDDVPPHASDFALSPALANALAQVHVYRSVLTEIAGTVDELYGLRESRDPLLVVVIGQASALPPHRLRVLRDLNLSLHRVAIVPYDVLARRARVVLDNVELHLTQAPPADAGEADA